MSYLLNFTFSILFLLSQTIYTKDDQIISDKSDIANIENITDNNNTFMQIDETKNKQKSSKGLSRSLNVSKSKSMILKLVEKAMGAITKILDKFNKIIENLFSKASSLWIRIFASLILGLLLSFTPCMFPMIPVTIGILQINAGTSKIKGFLTSLSYALGISSTFAVLGFIVALTSSIFGDFQTSIWAILPLAALLIYFGLSMFDFYEIKIPKFLQPKSANIRQGSFLSAYAFGAISGTVASSCLSPGIALILDYVRQLSVSAGSYGYLEGFLLLFIFGIGASLPLLIIGTFSNSSSFMPKAGPWMLEVKKLIGLMLIAMAFYHLSKLHAYIPWNILLIIIVISFVAFGAYYFKSTKKTDSIELTTYKYIVGSILILGSIAFGIYSSKYSKIEEVETESIWLNNFDQASKRAIEENKPLFIDLGSSFCAACKSIDKSVFQNPNVIKALQDHYIPIKINYDIEKEDFNSIKNLWRNSIKGFPTYIIADANHKLIKKMGSELGNLEIDDIVELLISSAKIK